MSTMTKWWALKEWRRPYWRTLAELPAEWSGQAAGPFATEADARAWIEAAALDPELAGCGSGEGMRMPLTGDL